MSPVPSGGSALRRRTNARALIRQGADVNAKDETVQSAYLIATSDVGDDPRLLELTLGNGARVNDKNSFNGTGLIRAAERGHPRIVRHLLRAGIDRDHVNRLGWTALHEAIVLGDARPDPHRGDPATCRCTALRATWSV
jgi:uncharacterized protein